MPKIPSLPALTTAADADEIPIEDVSASTTKKMTLTKLKEYLQALTSWVTPSMRSGGFYIGTLSITSTGNKVVTGVGFQPKAVLFIMSTEGAVASGANAGISFGVATAAASRFNASATTRNANGGYGETLTNKAFSISTIAAGGGSKSINVEGDLVSLDSDGFTINVATFGAAKTLCYICLA